MRTSQSVSTTKRNFSFEDLEMQSVVAHDGVGEILTSRVLEKANGTALNFIDMTVVGPGSSIGVHTHAMDNEEIYIVVTGQGEMFVDGESFTVIPGCVIANLPGGTHGLHNNGESDMKLIVIEVPVTDKP